MAWFENHYHCSACNMSWSDEWYCMVDDECPTCGADYSPESSTDITVIVVPQGASRWTVEYHPADDEDEIAGYQVVATFTSSEAAEEFAEEFLSRLSEQASDA